MSELIDLTGQKFGKLTVLGQCQSHVLPCGGVLTKWRCICDCGNIAEVIGSSLKRGQTRSCGCLKRETKPNYKHGMSHSTIHSKWLSILDRCYCENDIAYKNYGGRGISVCEEWRGKHGFENFYKWAMENGYDEDLTIDRIDVNGNYEPLNCRWTDIDIQANNKTNTIWVTYGGETLSLRKMCEKYGVNYHIAYGRYLKGFPIEQILFNKPWQSEVSGNRRKVLKIDIETHEILDKYDSAKEAAEKNNIRSRQEVTRVCKGKRKTAGGFIWKYVDE